jgi:hypothetical protein
VEISSDEGENLPIFIRRWLMHNLEARKVSNYALNDTSKDIKRKIPLFDDTESEWETDEEWGIRLASPSASAGPSKKKIKTEKEDEPSIAPALNPLSTSSVIPSVEVVLSDEEDYSFMMNDPWILRDRKKIQF